MNILIVEDDLHIQKLLSSCIREVDDAIQVYASEAPSNSTKHDQLMNTAKLLTIAFVNA